MTTSQTPLPSEPTEAGPQTDAPEVASKSSRRKDTSRPPGSGQGFVYQLAVVTAAALIVATLFTAWTPGQAGRPGIELFAAWLGNPTQGTPAPTASLALRPSPTFPPGAPTPTLRNPNLVGIVAGHWKNDSGAVCPDGLTEAAINLEIATRVQKKLVEAGYEVEVLSEFDERLNDYQAAALVSIHNDSCEFINTDASGFKVASAMATHNPEQAARLTACLRSRYGMVTQLRVHSTSVTRDMTSYHAFSEIHASTPAAIIETGFLNLDRAILTERPDVVAYGVAAGILCYLKNEPIATPTTAPTAGPTHAPITPVLPAAYPPPAGEAVPSEAAQPTP